MPEPMIPSPTTPTRVVAAASPVMPGNITGSPGPPRRAAASTGPSIRRVTSRTRLTVLWLIAVAWVFLGIVNLVRNHHGIGALYLVLGLLTGAAAMIIKAGRGAR